MEDLRLAELLAGLYLVTDLGMARHFGTLAAAEAVLSDAGLTWDPDDQPEFDACSLSSIAP
jgi:hypothetical protein